MSVPALAYLTSISRNFKAKTLTKGTINEILSESDWKNAVNILKERNYLEETSDNFEEMEFIIKKNTIENLLQLGNLSMSVKTSHDIVNLYYYAVTLDEFESLIASVENGVELRSRFFPKIVDAKPTNVNELLNVVRDTIHGKALQYALGKNPKNLSQLNSYLDYFFISELTKITEGLRGDWKSFADGVLCGYKDYYTVSLALRQKVQEEIHCKVSVDTIKDLVNARSNEEALDTLRRLPYARSMDFSNVYTALSTLHRVARVQARNASLNAFMGSPFTPVTALAIAELLKLDMEDLITILNGLKLGLPQEKIKAKLSLELV
ncbi:MAG: hypothetical protein ASUL_01520 [Candidatus Aramenus sulfurataquae]|jgi:vacuolar-type H+-ATPase subunit C/Vma6|uniref:ATPase n=2 Tax=Candidatus Aramenus sulfurataquae TaxID=1326980 RepID=W7KY74_9CREN|nr:MAG: hypothetical protein ASUL_01520 [Candidatus Aramenus sulfurataquae]MCL7343451.1 V-type ATPase subunit [Candidatus Aramenus sulfurataquae]